MDWMRKNDHQLTLLQGLVWFKRSLRLLIRTIWLGISGYLLAWGLNKLRGWFPDEQTWLLLGGVFAACAFLGIFFSWPSKKRFVWLLDRKFELQEQVSTAWSAAADYQQNPIVSALLQDVLHLYPRIRKRLLLRGWHLSRDLLALSIVLILGAGVFINHFLPATARSLDEVEVALLPPLGAEANADEIFPAGILGLKPTPTSIPSDSGAGAGNNGNQGGSDNNGSAQDALSNLGAELSKMAATYDLGQALQSGDANQAASEMENLADQVDNLDASTKDKLSQAMSSAANNLSTSQQEAVQELAQDLSDAARQLGSEADEGQDENAPSQFGPSSQSELSTQDSLDQVASDLREVGQFGTQTGGGGASGEDSESENSRVEPGMRLQGESDLQALEINGALEPGMLSPTDTEPTGNQAGKNPFNQISDTESGVVKTPLVPSSYPWIWRYVISTYFLRR